MSCANINCNKDPHNSIDSILVSADGDFVCCSQCETVYNRQRKHFFDNIVNSSEKTAAWLKGEISADPNG